MYGCSQSGLPTAKAPDISIHKAAEDGDTEAIKQHIAAGADRYSNHEWPPLHAAAMEGN